ncbi:MAG: hypothetical protein ACM34J_14010 [Ignavibacteria bacterium]
MPEALAIIMLFNGLKPMDFSGFYCPAINGGVTEKQVCVTSVINIYHSELTVFGLSRLGRAKTGEPRFKRVSESKYERFGIPDSEINSE